MYIKYTKLYRIYEIVYIILKFVTTSPKLSL